MMKRFDVGEVGIGSGRMGRAKVLTLRKDGSVLVSLLEESREFACDVLRTAGPFPLSLAPGDSVLTWLPDRGEARGVLLGRIDPGSDPAATLLHAPDVLVLEAKKGLTLRVGDGSITIREDGKILIQGKDLVSHAKRMNRIKGGAVSIN